MDVKMKLFGKLMTYNAAFFDKQNSGDILFRYNADVDLACGGLLSNLKLFTTRVISSLSLIGVLFYNSWQLAIIAVLILGCALMPLASVRRRIKRVVMGSVVEGAKVVSNYNETYSGNKTIASYNLQNKIYNT